MQPHMWRGKTYANFLDDCIDCKYCISTQGQDEILCSGRLRISNLCDFDMIEVAGVKNSDN